MMNQDRPVYSNDEIRKFVKEFLPAEEIGRDMKPAYDDDRMREYDDMYELKEEYRDMKGEAYMKSNKTKEVAMNTEDCMNIWFENEKNETESERLRNLGFSQMLDPERQKMFNDLMLPTNSKESAEIYDVNLHTRKDKNGNIIKYIKNPYAEKEADRIVKEINEGPVKRLGSPSLIDEIDRAVLRKYGVDEYLDKLERRENAKTEIVEMLFRIKNKEDKLAKLDFRKKKDRKKAFNLNIDIIMLKNNIVKLRKLHSITEGESKITKGTSIKRSIANIKRKVKDFMKSFKKKTRKTFRKIENFIYEHKEIVYAVGSFVATAIGLFFKSKTATLIEPQAV